MTNAQDKGNNFEFRRSPDSSNNRHHGYCDGALECLNCSQVYLIKDIDSFLDERRILWRLLLSQIKNSSLKQQIIGSLAVANAKETIIKDIQKDGILTDFCPSCITLIFKKRQFRV